MSRLNQIVFPVPNQILTHYQEEVDIERVKGFLNTEVGFFHLTCDRDEYRGTNPIQKTIVRGINNAVVEVKTDYYRFEAQTKESRSEACLILQELEALGNLFAIGITDSIDELGIPLVVCYDYHYQDNRIDSEIGYSTRVGVLQVQPNYGSFRGSDGKNLCNGFGVSFTQTHAIANGALICL